MAEASSLTLSLWYRRCGRPSTTISGDQAAGGAAGVDAATDDTSVGGVVIQGGIHAASKEDELIPARQHVGLRELKLCGWGDGGLTKNDDCVAVGGHDVVDDAQRGICQEDVGDLKGAIAVEKQPRGVLAGVAGEVEPRQVATGVPKPKGVRNAHITAGGVAAGRPYLYLRLSHQLQQRIRCRYINMNKKVYIYKKTRCQSRLLASPVVLLCC